MYWFWTRSFHTHALILNIHWFIMYTTCSKSHLAWSYTHSVPMQPWYANWISKKSMLVRAAIQLINQWSIYILCLNTRSIQLMNQFSYKHSFKYMYTSWSCARPDNNHLMFLYTPSFYTSCLHSRHRGGDAVGWASHKRNLRFRVRIPAATDLSRKNR